MWLDSNSMDQYFFSSVSDICPKILIFSQNLECNLEIFLCEQMCYVLKNNTVFLKYICNFFTDNFVIDRYLFLKKQIRIISFLYFWPYQKKFWKHFLNFLKYTFILYKERTYFHRFYYLSFGLISISLWIQNIQIFWATNIIKIPFMKRRCKYRSFNDETKEFLSTFLILL